MLNPFWGYCTQFIHKLGVITKPLIYLMRKGKPEIVIWSEECEASFASLKNCLSQSPAPHLPDLNEEFILRQKLAMQD